ncbi:MAG: hypothetical protein ACKVG0_10490, partial [Alphaproteobacteria bacterium]
ALIRLVSSPAHSSPRFDKLKAHEAIIWETVIISYSQVQSECLFLHAAKVVPDFVVINPWQF